MAFFAVNNGRGIASNRVKGAGTEPLNIGWGTSATAAAATDTGLGTAASEARTAGTSSRVTTTTSNDTYRVVGTITCAGSGKTITEVATFDDISAGVCAIHGSFTGIPLLVGDAIAFTIDWQFS